jgi:hypothetical protein
VTHDCSNLAASECKILAKDFWSQGANRWLVCSFSSSRTLHEN